MADLDGISFLRTTRGATPVIYEAGRGVPDRRQPGRRVDGDEVTVVGAGITLHEALKAADALAEEGVSARVIDLYSVKPIDADTLRDAGEATRRRIVVVEDHWPEGGLGEAVLSAFAGEERRGRASRGARDARLGQARRAARRGRHRRRRDRGSRPPVRLGAQPSRAESGRVPGTVPGTRPYAPRPRDSPWDLGLEGV